MVCLCRIHAASHANSGPIFLFCVAEEIIVVVVSKMAQCWPFVSRHPASFWALSRTWCILKKHSISVVVSSFPINSTSNLPASHRSAPLALSVPFFAGASSEKCLILPLSGVRDRSEEKGQPFSLLSVLAFLRCAYSPSSKLLFSSFHLLSFFLSLFGFLF